MVQGERQLTALKNEGGGVQFAVICLLSNV